MYTFEKTFTKTSAFVNPPKHGLVFKYAQAVGMQFTDWNTFKHEIQARKSILVVECINVSI